MKVLVVGSGGREHVLCWTLAKSKNVEKVYCAPGNAGIAQEFECVNIKVSELEKMADWAVENKIDFTVVGPEAPLCDGIVDVFKSRGLAIFGPSKAAAQLEGSKTFAKKFMEKYNIPTARAAEFDTPAPAKDYVATEFANGEKGTYRLNFDAHELTVLLPNDEEANKILVPIGAKNRHYAVSTVCGLDGAFDVKIVEEIPVEVMPAT